MRLFKELAPGLYQFEYEEHIQFLDFKYFWISDVYTARSARSGYGMENSTFGSIRLRLSSKNNGLESDYVCLGAKDEDDFNDLYEEVLEIYLKFREMNNA